jgi:hypothetical protein
MEGRRRRLGGSEGFGQSAASRQGMFGGEEDCRCRCERKMPVPGQEQSATPSPVSALTTKPLATPYPYYLLIGAIAYSTQHSACLDTFGCLHLLIPQ